MNQFYYQALNGTFFKLPKGINPSHNMTMLQEECLSSLKKYVQDVLISTTSEMTSVLTTAIPSQKVANDKDSFISMKLISMAIFVIILFSTFGLIFYFKIYKRFYRTNHHEQQLSINSIDSFRSRPRPLINEIDNEREMEGVR